MCALCSPFATVNAEECESNMCPTVEKCEHGVLENNCEHIVLVKLGENTQCVLVKLGGVGLG